MTCDGEAAGNGDGETAGEASTGRERGRRRRRRRRRRRDGGGGLEDADDGATARGGGGRLEVERSDPVGWDVLKKDVRDGSGLSKITVSFEVCCCKRSADSVRPESPHPQPKS